MISTEPFKSEGKDDFCGEKEENEDLHGYLEAQRASLEKEIGTER